MLKNLVIAGAMAMAMFVTTGAMGGAPTDKIRETTNKIIAIVQDPVLKTPDKESEKQAKIRAAADERFDWAEMARRSMGRNWTNLTPEQKAEFTRIFSDLVDRTYMDRVEGYSGEIVNYTGESIEDGFAKVQVVVVDKKNTEIHVEYRMMNKDNNWLIYDVNIEGVSLVNNYRTQFSDIFASGGYAELSKRISAKLAEKK